MPDRPGPIHWLQALVGGIAGVVIGLADPKQDAPDAAALVWGAVGAYVGAMAAETGMTLARLHRSGRQLQATIGRLCLLVLIAALMLAAVRPNLERAIWLTNLYIALAAIAAFMGWPTTPDGPKAPETSSRTPPPASGPT